MKRYTETTINQHNYMHYTYALSQQCFIISYTLGGHFGGLSRRLPLSINSIIWHPFIP